MVHMCMPGLLLFACPGQGSLTHGRGTTCVTRRKERGRDQESEVGGCRQRRLAGEQRADCSSGVSARGFLANRSSLAAALIGVTQYERRRSSPQACEDVGQTDWFSGLVCAVLPPRHSSSATALTGAAKGAAAARPTSHLGYSS
jgi:hypothetical protein